MRRYIPPVLKTSSWLCIQFSYESVSNMPSFTGKECCGWLSLIPRRNAERYSLRAFLAGWMCWYCYSFLWRAIAAVHNVYSLQFAAYYYRLHTVVIFVIIDLQLLLLREMWHFGFSLYQMFIHGLQWSIRFRDQTGAKRLFLDSSSFCHTSCKTCVFF